MAAVIQLGGIAARFPDNEYAREAYEAAKRHVDEVRLTQPWN